MSLLVLFIIAVCLLAYAAKVSRKNKADSVKSQNTETPNHFNLLDDNSISQRFQCHVDSPPEIYNVYY